jgi:hypothetical protein
MSEESQGFDTQCKKENEEHMEKMFEKCGEQPAHKLKKYKVWVYIPRTDRFYGYIEAENEEEAKNKAKISFDEEDNFEYDEEQRDINCICSDDISEIEVEEVEGE